MNIFEAIQNEKNQSSTFDLSHDLKQTMTMGKLTPIMCQEVIPGDVFTHTTHLFLRTMPLVFPLMHRVNIITSFYFVPNRLAWNQWNDFIRGGEDGKTDYNFPVIDVGDLGQNEYIEKRSLWDYLGFPCAPGGITPDYNTFVGALPFRAYQLIWENFYRDEDLQDKLDVALTSGTLSQEEALKIMTIRRVAWEKDYFTSCRPNAQKGDEVTIPLTGSAPISGTISGAMHDGEAAQYGNLSNKRAIEVNEGSTGNLHNMAIMGSQLDNQRVVIDGTVTGTVTGEADLSEASAISINDFRLAAAKQKFFELLSRGGNRIQEFYWNIYGVKTSDSRLMLPEYLGGGISPVVISDVMQQSPTTNSPLGAMAGKGTGTHVSHTFNNRFEEHGFIIGLCTVVPRSSYGQGMPRKFTQTDRFDYYMPQFANLGEQPVLRQELMWAPTRPDENLETFGYQAPWNFHRYNPSRMAGEMGATGSLTSYHMGIILDPTEKPILNEDFINCNPRKNSFAVVDDSEDELLLQVYHETKAKRTMPYIAKPGMHII